jgi:hypothetical protein
VSKEAAEKFARENNLIFVGESSALANQNIKDLMDALLESFNSFEFNILL